MRVQYNKHHLHKLSKKPKNVCVLKKGMIQAKSVSLQRHIKTKRNPLQVVPSTHSFSNSYSKFFYCNFVSIETSNPLLLYSINPFYHCRIILANTTLLTSNQHTYTQRLIFKKKKGSCSHKVFLDSKIRLWDSKNRGNKISQSV